MQILKIPVLHCSKTRALIIAASSYAVTCYKLNVTISELSSITPDRTENLCPFVGIYILYEFASKDR